MSGLSFLHVLGSREQRAIQLLLRCRLHRAGWHGVHGVYRGDIQGRERIGTVLTVPSGKVLVWDRGGVGGSVHWLSIRFVFTRWEFTSQQLLLQQGLYRLIRCVRSVCSWKIQTPVWIGGVLSLCCGCLSKASSKMASLLELCCCQVC